MGLFFAFVLREAPCPETTVRLSRPPDVLLRRSASMPMQLIGEYGLKNKREVWRVNLMVAKMRKAARELLTLEEHDPKRIFEGVALLRRLHNYGILPENQNQLDYVLSLGVTNILERRLQTLVFKLGFAKSIHQARVYIRQRHIRWVVLSFYRLTAFRHCSHLCAQSWQATRQHPLLHGPSREPKVDRLLLHLPIRWWSPWPKQAKDSRPQGWWWQGRRRRVNNCYAVQINNNPVATGK